LYAPLLSVKPTPPDQSLLEIMQDGVQEAHRSITKQVPGGGTTLTAVLILGDQMTVAHVGDSRAYLINENGELESLTRDHSLVKRLVELGQITTDEAATHPQRNVLYRALGQGEPFDPDIHSLHLPSSGFLLLCSDGLWNVVSEAEILRMVKTSYNPEEACLKLIDAANNAGGPDNISAILIRLPG
jgi:serine/threonine protein phosphatase PrpC